MCLATPVQVKKVSKNWAVLSTGEKVNKMLVEKLKPGDWVLVSHRVIVGKISSKEAKKILKIVQRCHHHQ